MSKSVFDENLLYEIMKKHVGHHVEIAYYGDEEEVALECEDCGCILFDTDCYDLIGVI